VFAEEPKRGAVIDLIEALLEEVEAVVSTFVRESGREAEEPMVWSAPPLRSRAPVLLHCLEMSEQTRSTISGER
jgi:hypothetical protein